MSCTLALVVQLCAYSSAQRLDLARYFWWLNCVPHVGFPLTSRIFSEVDRKPVWVAGAACGLDGFAVVSHGPVCFVN